MWDVGETALLVSLIHGCVYLGARALNLEVPAVHGNTTSDAIVLARYFGALENTFVGVLHPDDCVEVAQCADLVQSALGLRH